MGYFLIQTRVQTLFLSLQIILKLCLTFSITHANSKKTIIPRNNPTRDLF